MQLLQGWGYSRVDVLRCMQLIEQPLAGLSFCDFLHIVLSVLRQ